MTDNRQWRHYQMALSVIRFPIFLKLKRASVRQWILNSCTTMDGSLDAGAARIHAHNTPPTAPGASHHIVGPLA